MSRRGETPKPAALRRFLIGFVFFGCIAGISAFLHSSMGVGGPHWHFVGAFAFSAGALGGIAAVVGGRFLKFIDALFSGGP